MSQKEFDQLVARQKDEGYIEPPPEICKKIRAKFLCIHQNHRTTDDAIKDLSEQFPCYNVLESIKPIIDFSN